jgi:hypothetical protein
MLRPVELVPLAVDCIGGHNNSGTHFAAGRQCSRTNTRSGPMKRLLIAVATAVAAVAMGFAGWGSLQTGSVL